MSNQLPWQFQASVDVGCVQEGLFNVPPEINCNNSVRTAFLETMLIELMTIL
jgi:hypothetical protein